MQADVGRAEAALRQAADRAIGRIGERTVVGVDIGDEIGGDGVLHALLVVETIGPGGDAIDEAVAVRADDDHTRGSATDAHRVGGVGGMCGGEPIGRTSRLAVQQVDHRVAVLLFIGIIGVVGRRQIDAEVPGRAAERGTLIRPLLHRAMLDG